MVTPTVRMWDVVHGNSLQRIEERFADGSVDLVTASPPFLNLRDYTGGEDGELGHEPDPAAFIDSLLAHSALWGRKLTATGSIAIELGDTMSGTSYRARTFGPSDGDWPAARSLCMVPDAYAMSLAYGRNILTGEPSPAGRWRVVNQVVWCRPNPAPGSLGDRARFATSTIVIATKATKKDGGRWDDLTALRDPNGSPPLDYWTIPTQPSKLDHSATWPPELARRLIVWNCPEHVCVACGAPRRRIEQVPDEVRVANRERSGYSTVDDRSNGIGPWSATSYLSAVPVTVGWTDCGCQAGWRSGLVVDPFCGTGTTVAVAELVGRDAVGFDLDGRVDGWFPARRAEVRRTLLGAASGSKFEPKKDAGDQASLFTLEAV